MCKCCNEIEIIQELNKDAKTKHIIKAGITDIAIIGKAIKGTIIYANYDLKFCPLCRQKVR